MEKLKLNKSSMTRQRNQLKLYTRLLPSLELKRRQLTLEHEKAKEVLARTEAEAGAVEARIGAELPMIAETEIDLRGMVRMTDFSLTVENVVGVKLPRLESIECEVAPYSFLTKPAWVDTLVERLRDAAEGRIRVQVARERARILAVQVRRITQRVNLFEKILIPRTRANIKRIQIFLGDQERSAVVRSKIAKGKHVKERARARAEAAA